MSHKSPRRRIEQHRPPPISAANSPIRQLAGRILITVDSTQVLASDGSESQPLTGCSTPPGPPGYPAIIKRRPPAPPLLALLACPLSQREKEWDGNGEVVVVRGEGQPVRRRGGGGGDEPPELQRLLRAAAAAVHGAARQEREPLEHAAGAGAAARAAGREHQERPNRRRRWPGRPGTEPALLQRLLRGLLRAHPGRYRRAAEAVRQRHQLDLRQPPLRQPEGVRPVLRRDGRHRRRGPGAQEEAAGGGGRRRGAAAAAGRVQDVRRGREGPGVGAPRRQLDQGQVLRRGLRLVVIDRRAHRRPIGVVLLRSTV
jgi:hypothetical protein